MPKTGLLDEQFKRNARYGSPATGSMHQKRYRIETNEIFRGYVAHPFKPRCVHRFQISQELIPTRKLCGGNSFRVSWRIEHLSPCGSGNDGQNIDRCMAGSGRRIPENRSMARPTIRCRASSFGSKVQTPHSPVLPSAIPSNRGMQLNS